MNELFPVISIIVTILLVGLGLAGLILRQGTRLDKLDSRMDRLEARINELAIEIASLKATVETFFRVRIDPPPPGPEHHEKAA